MTKPTLSIFTGDKNLGQIFREQNQINSKFFEGNIPRTNTEGRFAFNLLGKTRILLIQAAHDGTGFSGATQNDKIADFVYEMEQWVNANVQDTISVQLTDSLENTYTVDAIDFTWNRTINDPFRITYTLLMRQR